jgi:hypothetical protein
LPAPLAKYVTASIPVTTPGGSCRQQKIAHETSVCFFNIKHVKMLAMVVSAMQVPSVPTGHCYSAAAAVKIAAATAAAHH